MTQSLAPAQPDTGGRLGVAPATALYLASVLGTGLLILPGLTAKAAGPASMLAVAFVAVLAIPLAATFASLAARYPDAGGVSSYVRLTLGALPARIVGYWFFFGVAIGGPVVAITGAHYLSAILGIDARALPVLAIVLMVIPLVTNVFGLRVTGSVQLLLITLLVGVVVFVIALAAPAVEPQNFTPFLPHGLGGFSAAVVMFVWAFAGWEVGTHVSAEFRNPSRTIPVATAIALVVSSVSYLGLQWVTVGALGAAAGRGEVVLLDLAYIGSRWAPGVVGVATTVIVLGVLNAYFAALGKLGASLAEAGDLPRWFARGVGAGEIPRRALGLTAVLQAIYLALFFVTGSNLELFIVANTACMTAVYVLGMIAATRLLPRGTFGRAMAFVAVVLTLGLLALVGWPLLLPVGLAVVAWLVPRSRSPRGRAPR